MSCAMSQETNLRFGFSSHEDFFYNRIVCTSQMQHLLYTLRMLSEAENISPSCGKAARFPLLHIRKTRRHGPMLSILESQVMRHG